MNDKELETETYDLYVKVCSLFLGGGVRFGAYWHLAGVSIKSWICTFHSIINNYRITDVMILLAHPDVMPTWTGCIVRGSTREPPSAPPSDQAPVASWAVARLAVGDPRYTPPHPYLLPHSYRNNPTYYRYRSNLIVYNVLHISNVKLM